MGNNLSCCFSRNQPRETPQSSSVLSIESIQNSIQQENTTEQIDKLIDMLDVPLSKITRKGEDVSTSSGMGYVASSTRSASQVVDIFSTEAENISDLEIISEELGSVGTRVLNAVAGTHFIFLGLSLVAYTIERYLHMKANIPACKELLEQLIVLAKEVKKFKEAVPGESENVRKAILEIVVGAVICRDCIVRGSASKLAL